MQIEEVLLQIFACIHITSHYFCMLSMAVLLSSSELTPAGASPQSLGEVVTKQFQTSSPTPAGLRFAPGGGNWPCHFVILFDSTSTAGFISLPGKQVELLE